MDALEDQMLSERTVTHETFVIERTYAAPPARVFAAHADPAVKTRWFDGGEGWEQGESSLDFRPGGTERNVGTHLATGQVHTYAATYWDIVPDRRIVACYEMYLDETRISVSLATTEMLAVDGGTRLIYTEQAAFLDGKDSARPRRSGTEWLLDRLRTVVEG